MPNEEQMTGAVRQYIAAYNQGNLDALVALFATDASLEDPVGTPLVESRDAIRAFFTKGIAMGAQLHLDGPVRVAADHAAFAFHVILDMDGRTTRIDVIDTFRFDSGGRVAEMRAFFGPGNMTTTSGD